MATIPRSYIDNYTRALEKVSAVGQEALGERLLTVDLEDLTRAANEIVEVMEIYCGTTAEASAQVSAEFYNAMSMLQTGESYQAEPISGHIPEATEKATRGIFQKAVEGDFDSMTHNLLGRLDYEVKKAAGETTMGNARNDPRGVRYARVPGGGETCDFCIMLASRGPVYHSAATAGELNHYHANCRCRIVPMWDTVWAGTSRRASASTIEGYDPDELYTQYATFMQDPKFRQRMMEGSLRARGKTVTGRVPEMSASPTAWRRAYQEGLTQFKDMTAIGDYIKEADSYEDLFHRIETLNKEGNYFYLGKSQIQQINQVLQRTRRELLGE